MMKRIKLVPHDSAWAGQYLKEKRALEKILCGYVSAVHHVGSTAVPGLMAKPRLDIVVVVKHPVIAVSLLKQAGFEYTGSFNIPFHYGFRRRIGIEVNLHVYEKNHPEIALNLIFRDLLIQNSYVRKEYEQLKIGLAAQATNTLAAGCGLSAYSINKGVFIRRCLIRAGFKRLRVLFCSDAAEWDYIAQHQNVDAELLAHERWCVFYYGAEMIGYASLCDRQDNGENGSQIAVFFIEKRWKRYGHYYRTVLSNVLENTNQ